MGVEIKAGLRGPQPTSAFEHGPSRVDTFCRQVDLLTVYDRCLSALRIADSLGRESLSGPAGLRARLLKHQTPEALDQALDWLKDNRSTIRNLVHQVGAQVRTLDAQFEQESPTFEVRPHDLAEHRGLLSVVKGIVTDLGTEGRALYDEEPVKLDLLAVDLEGFLQAT
ncbi:MAG: hypothetical protein K1X83_07915 [Oligoflexia bacterium]|nr:hypothetical protein [Oligoflexia bacterium]